MLTQIDKSQKIEMGYLRRESTMYTKLGLHSRTNGPFAQLKEYSFILFVIDFIDTTEHKNPFRKKNKKQRKSRITNEKNTTYLLKYSDAEI